MVMKNKAMRVEGGSISSLMRSKQVGEIYFMLGLLALYLLNGVFFNFYFTLLILFPSSNIIVLFGYGLPFSVAFLSFFYVKKRMESIGKKRQSIIWAVLSSFLLVYLTCMGISTSFLHFLYGLSIVAFSVFFFVPVLILIFAFIYCLFAKKHEAFISNPLKKPLLGLGVLLVGLLLNIWMGFSMRSIYDYIPPERFERLAADGSANDAVRMAYFFRDGVGVEKDIVKAIKFYELAYSKGEVGVLQTLAKLYEKIGDGKKAEYYLLQAAEKGSDAALYEINRIDFERAQPNPVEALECSGRAMVSVGSKCKDSAFMGNSAAQFHYAEHLIKSRSLLSIANAIFWYEQAAMRGHDGAKRKIAAQLYSGSYLVRNVERAAFWYVALQENGGYFYFLRASFVQFLVNQSKG
jgi:TPR repeat protein